MASPEVQFILDAIENNLVGYGMSGYGFYGYGHSDLSDVPVQRIDRDNSDNIDKADGIASLSGPVHEHAGDLEEMNFVSVASTTQTDTPIGTEYDHRHDPVVNVRIEGAHVSEHGAIDPYAGEADENDKATWPTTQWNRLVSGIRYAVLRERKFPGVSDPNVGFKDLFVENVTDLSRNYSDYYRYEFDVRYSGFENLP